MVLVHGGGFVLGSRRMPAVAALTRRLVDDGVAVVVFDYRKIGRGGRFAEAVDDVRAAFAWWGDRAASHGLDPARVVGCGLSAGAALLFAAGAGPARGLIGIYGVYDLADPPRWAGGIGPRLLFRTSDRRVWAERSPIAAFRDEVPVLLVHGEADGTVPCAQSRRMADAIAARGGSPILRTWPGEPHAFFADPRRPSWEPAYRDVLAFARSSP